MSKALQQIPEKVEGAETMIGALIAPKEEIKETVDTFVGKVADPKYFKSAVETVSNKV